MARYRKSNTRTPGAKQRLAQSRAGWNIYAARPTLGDVPDVLVEMIGPQQIAYARAREMNARLPLADETPFDFYYAAHGAGALPGMDRLNRLLDIEAERRGKTVECVT